MVATFLVSSVRAVSEEVAVIIIIIVVYSKFNKQLDMNREGMSASFAPVQKLSGRAPGVPDKI